MPNPSMGQRAYDAADAVLRYVPAPFITNAVSAGVGAVSTSHGNMLSGIFDVLLDDVTDTDLDNPMFTNNGHEGPSPKTIAYFSAKRGLGTLTTLAAGYLDGGAVVSSFQTAASATTWYRINALFQKLVPPSRRSKPAEYAHWYSYQVAKKAVPPGSLERQMTRILRQKMYGAAGGAARTAVALTGGVAGYFISSAASAWQEQLNRIFGQDVQTLAQGLHWFAFLETVVGRGVGKGPALRILDVLWTEFALGKLTISVPISEIVREPKGWLVIADIIN